MNQKPEKGHGTIFLIAMGTLAIITTMLAAVKPWQKRMRASGETMRRRQAGNAYDKAAFV